MMIEFEEILWFATKPYRRISLVITMSDLHISTTILLSRNSGGAVRVSIARSELKRRPIDSLKCGDELLKKSHRKDFIFSRRKLF